MDITVVDQGNGNIVLSLKGRCDFKSRHTYQRALDQAFQRTPKSVILDFTDVTYIDSAGLGLLALSHKKFSANAMCLMIAAPQKPVRQILHLANMGKIFPICDSLTAATQNTVSGQ
ncbi:MAG: STAS domain-containing protein [Nitrospirales bacterium]|nr:STAS domain-containing protein [Nitrospirales bacterium]